MFIDAPSRFNPGKESTAAPTGRWRCSTDDTTAHCSVCIASTGLTTNYTAIVDLGQRQSDPAIADHGLFGIFDDHI